MPHLRSSRGFTLVELMVTLTVLAVLAAIAFPSFQGVIRSTRMSTAANEMLASLALARSEAIRSARGSGVCPSSDGSSCGSDWSAGWLVWADSNGDGSLSAGETVVRYVHGKPHLQLSGDVATILFDRRGATRGFDAGGAAVAQTLVLSPDECPSGQDLARRVTIAVTGQVHMETLACE